MKVRNELLKHISPSTPLEARHAAASRGLRGELPPWDEVTVLFILGFEKDGAISAAARKSLEEYPAHELVAALEQKLDPVVIKKILEIKGDDEAVQIMAALNPGADDETLRRMAETGPEEVVAALADEKGLLSKKPFLIDALARNPHATATLVSELETLKASPPLPDKEKPPGPAPAGPVDENKARADEQNIYRLVSQMSMGQKLKLALSGGKTARDLLIKDSNKIISMAVLKNPKITEEEIHKVSSSKGSSDEVLRYISRNKDWMKSYSIRIGVLTNPKTPLTVSMKLLEYVYEKDLQGIAKSKNIPSVLASAARRRLESKGKG